MNKKNTYSLHPAEGALTSAKKPWTSSSGATGELPGVRPSNARRELVALLPSLGPPRLRTAGSELPASCQRVVPCENELQNVVSCLVAQPFFFLLEGGKALSRVGLAAPPCRSSFLPSPLPAKRGNASVGENVGPGV